MDSKMFHIESISGKPIFGGKCKGPVTPDEHGNIQIFGNHTGNVANFWMVLRMGEKTHRCICALGQHKGDVDAVHEVSFLAPRHGKYEPYHGKGTLEIYLDPITDMQFDPSAIPSVVIDIEEIVVE